MPESSFESALPVDEKERQRILHRWLREGMLEISGSAGSGRHNLAGALAAMRSPEAMVRTATLRKSPSPSEGWMLDELGLRPGDAADYSAGWLARDISNRYQALTIILDGEGYADAHSLRVLELLTDGRSGVKVIVIQEHERYDARTSGRSRSSLRIRCADMTTGNIGGIVERLLGSTPTSADLAALEAGSGSVFRGLTWLLDLAKRNDALHRDRGFVHILLGDVTKLAPPPWPIRIGLASDEAAQLLALTGGLPLAALEYIGVSAQLETLETEGLIVVEHDMVRLSYTALEWDVALRLPLLRMRTALHTIFEATEAFALPARQAATVLSWAQRVGIDPPSHLTSPAIRHLVMDGSHQRALDIGQSRSSVSHPAQVSLIYASVVLDEEEYVAATVPAFLARAPDLSDLEALGIALIIGLFRDTSSSVYADAFARVLHDVALRAPDSAAMLHAYQAIVDPRIDSVAANAQVNEAIGIDSPPHTRARALRALALYSWLDGRPLTAARYAADSDDVDTGSPPDAALSLFLKVSSALLEPDFRRVTRLLHPIANLQYATRTATLLWAGLSTYRGEISAGRLLLQPLTPGTPSAVHDKTFEPLGASLTSIASSMIGDGEVAQSTLASAYEQKTSSEFMNAVVEHFRAIAATQIRPSPFHDEGLAGYAAAADHAQKLRFRLLELFAAYHRADELGNDHRPELWAWLAEQTEGPEPLEGVPALLATASRAIGERDVRTLIDLVRQLHSSGLIHEAKVLSTRVLKRGFNDIPSTVRRTLTRFNERGLDISAHPSHSILTDREREVTALILQEKSDREIAEHLGLSHRTVNVHVGRILRKLNVANRHKITVDVASEHGVQLPDR